MRPLACLLLLSLSAAPVVRAAAARMHYSYRGNGRAGWTRTVEQQPAAPLAGAADYTVLLGSANGYKLSQIVTDASGNTYVAGDRLFPSGVFTSPRTYFTDIFVAKLDTSGNTVFMATMSGKGDDHATSLALDTSGNIYLAGNTHSANFPLRNPLQSKPAGLTGFLVKLSPDGSQLIYSTYLGGTIGGNSVNAIAVDAAGNVYAAGNTSSPDFPQSPGFPGAQLSNGPGAVSGAFVAKIAAAGDRILYSAVLAGNTPICCCGSTCFLSARVTAASAISLDAAGNVYFAGNTNASGLPTTANALVAQGSGGFVGRINAAGTALDYLTYLGTAVVGPQPFVSGATRVNGLAVDAAGNAYLTGSTSDSKFPVTPGALQTTLAGQTQPPNTVTPTADAFAARLSPDGSRMVWATYLGRSKNDAGQTLALDASGNVWLAGTTDSTDFPNANGWTTGGDFLVELNASGSSLPYSALYPAGTLSQSIALDSAGVLHLAGTNGLVSTLVPGQTPSKRIFAIVNTAGGETAGGRIAPGEVISIFGPNIGPAAPVYATVDASGKIPNTLGGIQVMIGGTPAPLFYVSANQINAVTPIGVPISDSVRVAVVTNAAATPDFNVVAGATSPGIFRIEGNRAAAINQDGTVNSADHPAKFGSIVTLWVNGAGFGYPASDGQVQTAAQNYSCCSVQIENQPVEVLYAGAAPGMVTGISQINLRLPAQLSTGTVSSVTVITTDRTDSAEIYVTP